MGLILDTSVLIAAERGRFRIADLFAAYPDEGFYIATITAAELLHGVERAKPQERRAVRSAVVEQYLLHLELIDFDLAVARRHAVLWASLETSGIIIGPYDMLIAATALEYNHRMVTLNTSEFSRVPALQLVETASFIG